MKSKNANASTSATSATSLPEKKRKADDSAPATRPKAKKVKEQSEAVDEDLSDIEMVDSKSGDELEDDDQSDSPQAHYEKLSAMAAADKKVGLAII